MTTTWPGNSKKQPASAGCFLSCLLPQGASYHIGQADQKLSGSGSGDLSVGSRREIRPPNLISAPVPGGGHGGPHGLFHIVRTGGKFPGQFPVEVFGQLLARIIHQALDPPAQETEPLLQ